MLPGAQDKHRRAILNVGAEYEEQVHINEEGKWEVTAVTGDPGGTTRFIEKNDNDYQGKNQRWRQEAYTEGRAEIERENARETVLKRHAERRNGDPPRLADEEERPTVMSAEETAARIGKKQYNDTIVGAEIVEVTKETAMNRPTGSAAGKIRTLLVLPIIYEEARMTLRPQVFLESRSTMQDLETRMSWARLPRGHQPAARELYLDVCVWAGDGEAGYELLEEPAEIGVYKMVISAHEEEASRAVGNAAYAALRAAQRQGFEHVVFSQEWETMHSARETLEAMRGVFCRVECPGIETVTIMILSSKAGKESPKIIRHVSMGRPWEHPQHQEGRRPELHLESTRGYERHRDVVIRMSARTHTGCAPYVPSRGCGGAARIPRRGGQTKGMHETR